MNNYKIFNYSLVIKEHHLDTFGHVNNATYLEILEEARWELLHQQGISLQSIQSSGIGPVILEISIKFMKEIKLRQNIIIQSQLQTMDKKTSTMRQLIVDENKEHLAEALITFGVFDLKTRKLILPPENWLSALT